MRKYLATAAAATIAAVTLAPTPAHAGQFDNPTDSAFAGGGKLSINIVKRGGYRYANLRATGRTPKRVSMVYMCSNRTMSISRIREAWDTKKVITTTSHPMISARLPYKGSCLVLGNAEWNRPNKFYNWMPASWFTADVHATA